MAKEAIHEVALGGVLERYAPWAGTTGFRREVSSALGGEVKRFLSGWRYVPDAYILDPEMERLVVFEVEDSHPLTYRKYSAYADLAFALDCEEWEFKLFSVDRYGGEKEVDLLEAWLLMLRGGSR